MTFVLIVFTRVRSADWRLATNGSPFAANNLVVDGWFNPAAFMNPALYTFGNTPRAISQFRNPGAVTRVDVTLDLGAVGKGYALDCGRELLLQGGTSSVLAVGKAGWPVAIRHPLMIEAAPVAQLVFGKDDVLHRGRSEEANGASGKFQARLSE